MIVHAGHHCNSFYESMSGFDDSAFAGGGLG
jgi:hypothetical protein